MFFLNRHESLGCLGGGFIFFSFSPLVGEMIQFDSYFANRLKPPIRCFMEVRCPILLGIADLFHRNLRDEIKLPKYRGEVIHLHPVPAGHPSIYTN